MKKILSVLFALALLAGLMISPVSVAAASSSPLPNDDISMGDMILRAYYEKKAAEAYDEADLSDFAFHYRLVDAEVFSEKFVELGAIWDRDYLYLAYELQEGYPDAQITINGIQVTEMETKETDTHVLVKIPLASVNAYIAAYGNSYSMNIKLDDLFWDGDVMFTKRQTADFNTSNPSAGNREGEYSTVVDENNVYLESTADYAGFWPNPCPVAVYTHQEQLYSGTTPTIVEFDFQSPQVPEKSGGAWIEGFEVDVMDETGEGKPEKRQGLSLHITSVQGDITLVGNTNRGRYGTGIAADSNAKIHFRVEYYNQNAYCNSTEDFNNCGMRVYVNGLLVLEQEDAKQANSGVTLGVRTLAFAGRMNGFDPLEGAFTNIEVYHEAELTAKTGSIDSVEMSHLLGDNTDENAITSDMTLIKHLPDGQVNGTSIEWTSSNEAIISKDGKVTAPAEDTIVELKATVRSTGEYKTFQVTVKKAAPVLVPGVDGEMTWIYIAAGAAVLVVIIVVVIVVAAEKSKKKKAEAEE